MEHGELGGIVGEQFGDEAVPEPDEGDGEAGDRVDGGEEEGELGRLALLDPEAEAVEAPRGGPAHGGAEGEAIDEDADGTEADFVVVPGEEAGAVGRRGDVLPVSGAGADEGPGLGGAELEGGAGLSIWADALAYALTGASDGEAGDELRFVKELLWLVEGGAWEVLDGGEAEIPALVDLGGLGVAPDAIYVAMDEGLDVDAGGAHAARVLESRAVGFAADDPYWPGEAAFVPVMRTDLSTMA